MRDCGSQGRSIAKASGTTMAVSKPRYSLTLTKNVRKDVTRAIPLVASFEEPGKSGRTSAPRVGRKTRVVRRSDPSGGKFAKLIASSHPHVDDQHGDAQRERERVVADVPCREQAQEVARQLHEERRGVREAVDEERVEASPEERADLAEWREDERFDAFVHVPLVRDEAAEGTGLLVEGVRLRRDGLRRPVGFAVPVPCRREPDDGHPK